MVAGGARRHRREMGSASLDWNRTATAYADLPYRDQVSAGGGIVGVGLVGGRQGYSRHRTVETIGRAGRSIALHAGGASWAEADEAIASEVAPAMDPTTIAGYRKRLRDRLE